MYVTDRESQKEEECQCVRVCRISRPHQSLMALHRDTGAENYLICWAALLQSRSVLF